MLTSPAVYLTFAAAGMQGPGCQGQGPLDQALLQQQWPVLHHSKLGDCGVGRHNTEGQLGYQHQ